MALIKCCECSTVVSEFAEKCPKCGCPVSISLKHIAQSSKDAEDKKTEKDRLAAEKLVERKQRADKCRNTLREHKKRIVIAGVLLLAILFAVYFIAEKAGIIDSVKEACAREQLQEQCLLDLRDGLYERWNVKANNASFEEYKKTLYNCVEIELQKMAKYSSGTFESGFGNIIDRYIGALESQKEGIDYLYKDAKKFNELFYDKGMKTRSECLRKLIEEYDFEINEEYKQDLDKLLKDYEYKVVELGETVKIRTSKGEINITFIDYFIETDRHDGKKSGRLLFEAENVSFVDNISDNFVRFEPIITITDDKGYYVSPSNTCTPYGEYANAGATFAQILPGEKKKLTTLYAQENMGSMVSITAHGDNGEYTCYISGDTSILKVVSDWHN